MVCLPVPPLPQKTVQKYYFMIRNTRAGKINSKMQNENVKFGKKFSY